MMVRRGGLTGVSPGFLVVWLSGDHRISTVGLPCKYLLRVHACRGALAGRRLTEKDSPEETRKKLCFRPGG